MEQFKLVSFYTVSLFPRTQTPNSVLENLAWPLDNLVPFEDPVLDLRSSII